MTNQSNYTENINDSKKSFPKISVDHYLSHEILEVLSQTPLQLSDNFFSGLFEKKYSEDAQKVLHSLLMRKFYYDLSDQIQKAQKNNKKNLSIFLPNEWQEEIKKFGFNIPFFKKYKYYCKYQFINLIKGLWTIIFLLSRSFFKKNKFTNQTNSNKSEVIFFPYLSKEDVPKNENFLGSHDFVSWYITNVLKQDLKSTKIVAHIHQEKFRSISKNIYCTPYLFEGINNIGKKINFLIKSVSITIAVVFKSLLGYYWAGILYEQAILLAYVKCLNKEQLPSKYIFHHDIADIKPLWTYYVETCKSIFYVIFLSANNTPLHILGEKKPPENPVLKIMQWKNYYTLDQYQSNWIKKLTKKSLNTIETGPIAFSKSNSDFEKVPNKKYVLVLPIMPINTQTDKNARGVITNDYNILWSEKFLSDIYKITSKNKFLTAIKQKRFKGKQYYYKPYLDYIDTLSKKTDVQILDPGIGLEMIYDMVDGAICFPFTSAAFFSNKYKTPTIFYDVSNQLNASEEYTHGVKCLRDFNSLEKWVQGLSKNF